MKINTSQINPPIPSRSFDWTATFDDYDGSPDASPEHQLIGYGDTEESATWDLLGQLYSQHFKCNTRVLIPPVEKWSDASAFFEKLGVEID